MFQANDLGVQYTPLVSRACHTRPNGVPPNAFAEMIFRKIEAWTIFFVVADAKMPIFILVCFNGFANIYFGIFNGLFRTLSESELETSAQLLSAPAPKPACNQDIESLVVISARSGWPTEFVSIFSSTLQQSHTVRVSLAFRTQSSAIFFNVVVQSSSYGCVLWRSDFFPSISHLFKARPTSS